MLTPDHQEVCALLHTGSPSNITDLLSYCQTITPYNSFEPMLADETTSGNPFYPYSNGHGFHSSDFMNNGFVKQFPSLARKQIAQAVFAANGQMTNSSGAFNDNGQAFLQHFMNVNPGGLMNMKLWWEEVVMPEEVRYKDSLIHSLFPYLGTCQSIAYNLQS